MQVKAAGARVGTRASRLTLSGAPACEPGGGGESDHSDSSCLVSSSTLAAAVSSSICFRSMCFMARAEWAGVVVRTGTSRQGPAFAPHDPARQALPPTPAHTGSSGPEGPVRSGMPRCPWCRPEWGACVAGEMGGVEPSQTPPFQTPPAGKLRLKELDSAFTQLAPSTGSSASPVRECQLLQHHPGRLRAIHFLYVALSPSFYLKPNKI